MKTITTLFMLLLAGVTLNAQQKFGGEVKKTDVKKATEIKSLLASTTEVKEVTVTGKVEGVCQAKGCWMTMDIGGEMMRVKFKDYAFFMPKDCSGKEVTMTGRAYIKEISVAEQKHLAEDAGKSKKEIKKITKPVKEYCFEATGVELEG